MTNSPFIPVKEKKVIGVEKRSYKKTYMAIALAMMLVFVSVMFYMLSSVDESEFIPEDVSSSELEDWNVYFVDSTSDLPTCDEQRNGRLYYVDSTESFEVCTTDGWNTVEIKGADGIDGVDGQNGTSGSDGADGSQGPTGQNGADGQNGTDGITTLIQILSNTTCATGGKSFEIGADNNRNGVLDITEVVVAVDICDGEPGQQGPPGQDGVDGTDGADGANGTNGSASASTMLTSISSPHPSLGCTAGGRVIQQGLDNGDGGGTAQNGVLESGEVDYTTTYCSKYVIWMVDDIYCSGGSSPGSYMEMLVGGTLYFSARCGSGYELWAHDTSNLTTWQVADIYPGSGDSSPGNGTEILVGDTLYFDADGGIYDGRELWAHDTSNHSTWQVADISSGSLSSHPGFQGTVKILIGDTLYFSPNDGIHNHELWAHDTSNHSTWIVADIRSGAGPSMPGLYLSVLVGDTLYFSANDGTSGTELWAMKIEHSITYD